jgi:hypothetical protein
VSTAVAVWADPTVTTRAFADFADGLPAPVEVGPLPSPEAADDWALRHTRDLIDRFPLEVSEALLVVATALATRVQWEDPFDRVPASLLGGTWADRVATVLQAPEAHQIGIARTTIAGDVAVHAARSADALAVVSVIAAPEVPAPLVIAAAHEVAPLVLLRHSDAEWRSLFDLPLGAGHAWSLQEHTVHGDPDPERYRAWLPAWEASAWHDLASAGVGFGEAIEVARPMVDPSEPLVAEAVQVVRAAFGAEGFEAAALTVLGVVRGMPRPDRAVKVREVDIRFDRPYAAVALTDVVRGAPAAPAPAWAALPVFAAWVAEPTEA